MARRKKPVCRAWVHVRSGQIYMLVGRRWYEHGTAYDECPSSVAWMRTNCLELHRREANRLNTARLRAMGRKP